MSAIRVAILTISDRCSQGITQDTSGPGLAEMARKELQAEIVATACTPDEMDAIESQLRAWLALKPAPDLILTTGGTGLSPRDVTPEATQRVVERFSPGLLELARARCLAQTPRAYLSRGVAGATGVTLIINLPGSLRGSTSTLQAMTDVLPHAISTLRGEVKDG